jgi:murein DD-endopeptidase MepM/ murein hydrolase activator NlpD
MHSPFVTIRKSRLWVGTILIVALLSIQVGTFINHPTSVNADEVADLQSKIQQRNSEIADLEKEIKEYQKQIDSLGTQANSLSATIKSLELTQKKLEADISVTQNKISAKNLEIKQLSGQITEKEGNIVDNKRVIASSITNISRLDNQSTPELLLGSNSLSSAWDALENLGILQSQLQSRIANLREVKATLENNKRATEKAKGELITLQNQLTDQRKVVLATSNEKNALLKETKQSEASYKKLLAEKKARKEAFEREVLNYESQLKLAVDSSKLPRTGTHALEWPLDKVRITQYFGNTEFATANSQIYNGKGHTGIDLGASIGTPIKAAGSGIVVGVGNTDIVPTCYSYGKWVMIKHPNGLSTLYAHMSVQSVSTGQEVTVGDVIGYSGNTGYTTGPHLHFGVYATQGVQIKAFDTSVNCKGVLIPLADFKAYLNPLSYL